MRIKTILSGRAATVQGWGARAQYLAVASLLCVAGCASAATVSDMAAKSTSVSAKNEFTFAEANLQDRDDYEIVIKKDGEARRLKYKDLSAEERADIDRELERVEIELQKAGVQLELVEQEMEDALVELQVKVEAYEEGNLSDLKEEERRIVIELHKSKSELHEAEKDHEQAVEELSQARTEIRRKYVVIEKNSTGEEKSQD